MRNEEHLHRLEALEKQFYDTGYLTSSSADDLAALKWTMNEARKVEKLESARKEIAEIWIRTLISHIKLMNEHHPEWKIFAEKEIKQLTLLIDTKK
ncbi:hypothetical protein [Bacillus thuringiensis]|uniref:Uncharacterized protein n=1 Tax=Bacillus thuringiensis TaxID=1428 RepID=A0A9X6ZQT3_BACTU|nr:hypothetical protein [Bacillus thuringiensis]PFJ33187.1 hypothetical protein COJ15_28510 [Bacillus thuringiensis]